MLARVAVLSLFVVAAPLSAQETTATINMKQAVVSCQEGVHAAAGLKATWAVPAAEIEKRDAEIKAARASLDRDSKRRHGPWPFRHAMSAKSKNALSHQIDVKAAALEQDRRHAREAFDNEQRRIIGQIGSRMISILQSYAKEHGYSLILDSSQQEGPVVVALNDITKQIITLYDQAFPAPQGSQ